MNIPEIYLLSKSTFFFSIPFYQIYLPKASEFHIFPLFLCYFQTYPSPTGVPGKVNIYSPGLIFAYLNTTLIGHLRINISIMALMILIITLQILTYQKWSLFSFIQYIPTFQVILWTFVCEDILQGRFFYKLSVHIFEGLDVEEESWIFFLISHS